MGQDEFGWKVNDGEKDSNVATVKLVMEATIPVPESQMAYLLKGATLDFPAAFTGGGGYAYKIQTDKPAHGVLTWRGVPCGTNRRPGSPAQTTSSGA